MPKTAVQEVSMNKDALRATGVITWNEQSLAAHDKNDLHWTELFHAHFAALDDSITKLAAKDQAEENNAADD